MEKALLTIEEVAQVLSLGRSTVYGLVQSGELRTIMVGRSRRIPVAAIDEFVKARLAAEGKEPQAWRG